MSGGETFYAANGNTEMRHRTMSTRMVIAITKLDHKDEIHVR
jgi:hypothetical protein